MIKVAGVLVLGITFKEDYPDQINTKVIHIIEELKTFGCNNNVYDPWLNVNEHKNSFNINIIKNPFKANKKYDTIVVSIAHKELKDDDYRKFSIGEPILIDIKGIVNDSS